jgi:hypothetical protein
MESIDIDVDLHNKNSMDRQQAYCQSLLTLATLYGGLFCACVRWLTIRCTFKACLLLLARISCLSASLA